MKEKLIFNWSGGKDSALALWRILQSPQYEIGCLLTSISETYQRISMHGVRVELLEAQAERIGIPLVKLLLPEKADMETYNQLMKEKLLELSAKGATASVFGDIFLEDLRAYRENKLAELDIKAIFPLWKLPTRQLVHEFIALGFKAIVTCVDERRLDKSFAGRIIDESFINDLPPGVDPCGENGEFHSFVFDAPYFSRPIDFEIGELVHRKYSAENTASALDGGFWYCDLLPVQQALPV